MGLKLLDGVWAKEIRVWHPATGSQPECISIGLPNYSTNISDAWGVVEKLAAYRPSKFLIEKCGAWLVRFDDGPFTPGATAPHAICLAALKGAPTPAPRSGGSEEREG